MALGGQDAVQLRRLARRSLRQSACTARRANLLEKALTALVLRELRPALEEIRRLPKANVDAELCRLRCRRLLNVT